MHPVEVRNNENGVAPIWGHWSTANIVYVAIIGGVMLMAILEWILWLLSFLYCLVKVYQKASGKGKWMIRFLCVLNMIFFTLMRCIYLPVMIVTLPLPAQITQYFPEEMVSILQWFAFWSFSGLLVIPWLICIFQLVTHNVGRQRRVKTVLDEFSAPKVVIIMPCYNEEPEILLRTVDSIVDCEYPPSCLHVFLSFDGDQENDLYLNTIEKLGVPLTLDTYPTSIDVMYRSCRITVSRFPHGGKRSCQKKSFRLIDKVYAEYLRRHDNLFLLFIDSDCILDKVCIQNFMYEMELKPGSKHDMLAMTGVITSTTEKHTLITLLQDMEYIHGQIYERTTESACGAVTCLPGALTILRFSAFRKMAKYYFADKAEQCEDLFDYGKCHLGEDRWLTHLFMIGAQGRYQIQMNTGAFCKTEAVQTFRSLIKQRRRWFMGFITNEACMLTDIRIWKRYPTLVLLRLANNTIRTTSLLFFIMLIALITTSQRIQNLPWGFICVVLGLNWALMLYMGAKLGRFKIMLYPLMFLVNPFLNWLYMVYGIFTAGQRTWGGPRADAGKADEHTTPAQAVEEAKAQGDELNVVPETFKPALEAVGSQKAAHTLPLLPSSHLEGRFAPAELLPGGWYQQGNESGALHADMTPRTPGEEGLLGDPLAYKSGARDSTESFFSNWSTHTSMALPRRVESIFGMEDTSAYLQQQAMQRPAGGAFFEAAESHHQPEGGFFYPAALKLPETRVASVNASSSNSIPRNESVASFQSDSTAPLHFPIPVREAIQQPLSDPSQRQAPTPVTASAPSADTYIRPLPESHRGRSPQRPFAGSSAPVERSPLARREYTRFASDDDLHAADAREPESIELLDRTSAPTSTNPGIPTSSTAINSASQHPLRNQIMTPAPAQTPRQSSEHRASHSRSHNPFRRSSSSANSVAGDSSRSQIGTEQRRPRKLRKRSRDSRQSSST